MKKRLLLGLAMIPLALTSCGSKGYEGTYSFQMGKQSGAHVTTSMELTSESYLIDGKESGKRMSLYGQMQMGSASSGNSSADSSAASSSVSSSEEYDISLLDLVTNLLAKGVTVNGYYRVGDATSDGRNNLHIGFNLDIIKSLFGIESLPSIDSSVVEQFIYCQIDSNKIYMQIPVSFTDLQYQLYWYGHDIPNLYEFDHLDSIGDLFPDGDSSEDSQSSGDASSSSSSVEPVDPLAHPVGTKPTAEDIAAINETYPQTHNGTKYRMFHTVSVGLTRQ